MEIGVDYTGVTVVFLCHDGKGNVLLSKRGKNCRDEQGMWDPGGGGLEWGETVEQALQKEIREEYGADVLDFEFLGYSDLHRRHKDHKTHWIALEFKVLVDREKVKNNEPHKFDAVQWFPITALPKPLHSHFPQFLEKYKNKLPKKTSG